MFTIVTHHSPDLDAVTAIWLIKRFLPNWEKAEVKFVPAGKTLDDKEPDEDPHIFHVDTGLGRLDHHQTDEFTCAAEKVYQYLETQLSEKKLWEDKALQRMCKVVCFFDHFLQATLPDAADDRQIFQAVEIINGLNYVFESSEKVVEMGMLILDSIYNLMKRRVWAEEILANEGKEFTTKWGKGIGFVTHNDEVLDLAQKKGFVVVVRKDPKKGYLRIKGLPGSKVNFSRVFKVFQSKDRGATWFLHSSKKMVLNGSSKNPDMKPTSLSLEEIIEVLEE